MPPLSLDESAMFFLFWFFSIVNQLLTAKVLNELYFDFILFVMKSFKEYIYIISKLYLYTRILNKYDPMISKSIFYSMLSIIELKEKKRKSIFVFYFPYFVYGQ